MPNGKPGDHPATDVLLGLAVFDRKTDETIRSLATLVPPFLLHYLVDWFAPDASRVLPARLPELERQAGILALGPAPPPERYPAGMAEIPWQPPWYPILPGLEAQLRRELSPGHPLFGLPAVAVARRADNDDVLFYLPGSERSFAIVHLTWTAGRQPAPDWPHTIRYDSLGQWARDALVADAERE
jgi:hypothetical protein